MKKIMYSLIAMLAGVVVTTVAVREVMKKEIEVQRSISEKHLALFQMMDQWVAVKQQGKNLADYLERMGYRTIAIYGMSYAGQRMVEELKGSNIKIEYGIDKRAGTICSDINVVMMEDELAIVDAIVVTPITFYDEIEKELSEKIDCPILSLENILYET